MLNLAVPFKRTFLSKILMKEKSKLLTTLNIFSNNRQLKFSSKKW